MSIDLDPPHASYAYLYAGNAAKELYEKTRKQKYLENWYDAYLQSAEIAETILPKHAAHAYMIAGRASSMLGKVTRQKKYNSEAIRCYQKFIDYYTANPDPSQNWVLERMQNNILFLKKFI